MTPKSSHHSPSQTENDVQYYKALVKTQLSSISEAIKVCSIPLWLTHSLADELLECFAPGIDTEQFYQQLAKFDLLIRQNKDEWRLKPEFRRYFLTEMEEQNSDRARQVHTAVLNYIKSTPHSTMDKDHDQLQRAYHTTPSDQDAGANLYWSIYCRIYISNRFAMLPVLARLTQSQIYWLGNHELDIKLYCAAALYHEEIVESKPQAAKLLEEILMQGASVPITLESCFLLATLKEQTNREEAMELYERAMNLKDDLDFANQNSDVQRHLRLTLSKSFSNLAGILQTRGTLQDLEKAEEYYRRGLQIVSDVEPEYEATQLRHLVRVLQKRGEEIEGPIQRLSEIELPFRQKFLDEVLAEFRGTGDIGPLYYAISALNHGLGYDSQLIQIEVKRDGAAQLTGTYTLRATSVLSHTDTYLETVPESEVGVHFEGLESLTPEFTLNFRRLNIGDTDSAKIGIVIDPPMQPGDQLNYRWTAQSSPGTFATTPQQFEEAKLDYEYAAWDVIVPMRELRIQVVIPAAQMRPPHSWFEVWRVGNWHATSQAQTAYQAFLKDNPNYVRWHAETKLPDKVQIGIKVNFPWLSMRYVLAWVWEVEG